MTHWNLYNPSASIKLVSNKEREIISCLGRLLRNKQFWNTDRVAESTLLLNYELFKLGTKEYGYKIYVNNSVPKLSKRKKDDWQKKFDKLVLGMENKRYRLGKRESRPDPRKTKFINREQLVDLHWYSEPPKLSFISTKLLLVAESEWSFKRPELKEDRKNSSEVVQIHSEAFYDFQKLLYCNAELRLLIFRLRRPSDLDQLYQDFFDRVQEYKGLPPKSKILIAAFHIKNGKKKLFYCRIKK